MDVNARNVIVTEYHSLIWWIIRQNMRLLKALQLEEDDVYQDLMITAMGAIESFDPCRSSSMRNHVASKLQYEVLNMRRRHKPHGMIGLKGTAVTFVSLEYQPKHGYACEIPVEAAYGEIEISDAMALLSPVEEYALRMTMDGESPRQSMQRAAYSSARDKIRSFYEEAHALCY